MLLGVTYKKDVKDLRESPSLDIIDYLRDAGAEVSYHDPFIPFIKLDDIDMKVSKLSKVHLTKQDCVIIVTDHTDIDYKFVQKNAKLVYDTRNVFDSLHTNVVKL